ncbi:MAG: T6SS effector BTH_I2691 family protein, partial [Acinetobacter sp.]
QVANQRAQEHLNWINSESLLDALDVYDDQDLQNGCAFKAHVACMLFGMEGADLSAKQIDSWIKKPEFERKNLFIRGLYSNQLEAKAKHDDMIKAPHDNTALGIKILKSLTDFMKKMDSAWDEYARVHNDKNKLKGFGQLFIIEQKMMVFVSNLSRAFFRFGLGTTVESRFINTLTKKLLYPQLGKLTEKLRFDQLFYGVDPEKFTVGKAKDISYVDAKIDSKLAKFEVQKTLDQLITDAELKSSKPAQTLESVIGKDMKDATNNYHQVRASGVLIIIESINLTYMLHLNKYHKWQDQAALLASITALTALSLDIFYGLAKGIRETANQSLYTTANSAAIKGAANIQRGAIKFAAGSLGAIAGGISAVLDINKGFNQVDKVGSENQYLKYLYFTRGAVTFIGSTIMGVLATLTYLEPVLNYIKDTKSSPLISRLGKTVIIKALTKDVARAGMLRIIGWAAGIGLLLTLVEVGVFIYMEFSKLQRWCEHSIFRKNKNNKLMSEKQEVEDYQGLFI